MIEPALSNNMRETMRRRYEIARPYVKSEHCRNSLCGRVATSARDVPVLLDALDHAYRLLRLYMEAQRKFALDLASQELADKADEAIQAVFPDGEPVAEFPSIAGTMSIAT